MTARRLVGVAGVAALVVSLVTACSGQSSSGGATKGPSTAASKAQIRAAHLESCPSSSSEVVSGGLPNLTLPCLGQGPDVHLAGLTGKPTVVNVWGSWCTECQKEEPYLTTAYDALRHKVRFLGVDSVDEADSAINYGMRGVNPPIRFPSVFDPDHKVLNGLHFDGTPLTVFVDATGRIVGKNYVAYRSTAAVERDVSKYLHVST
ncbi:MAG TPA: TlpA disulfide reductase family protein [Mycobacteriales bacterium]|nr:TlpA disulfide reductase family protein [Mycobacteriales bacterium]